MRYIMNGKLYINEKYECDITDVTINGNSCSFKSRIFNTDCCNNELEIETDNGNRYFFCFENFNVNSNNLIPTITGHISS